ncbi:dienelactone hydrolase family protein [Undibacterium jejuense]|uniref:Dienelactone hydrolase family protein n=2 Tax=Undibacterium jejuense TaxID=1344949 RepID=A0A923KJC1_9BURK|nr:dienelactone hydrolase family protein [Undibacterium jejuense]
MRLSIRYVFFTAIGVALAMSSSAMAQESNTNATAPIVMAADLFESVVNIDVSVKDLLGRQVTGKVVLTQFKPNGDGPFPIMILNHGRSGTNRDQPARFRYTAQARYFVKRGFAVFVPTRIGYGELGTTPDPEDSGSCRNKNYAPSAEAASTEVIAVLDYAKQLPYIDPKKVLIVGQSVGGYTTVATAAKNPPGVLAAINFAGGAGGDPDTHPGEPCEAYKLEQMYAKFGTASKVPMLWVYTENDLFFAPKYSQAWFNAFTKAGGTAEFHLMPAFEKNGHSLFAKGIKLWTPLVDRFLDEHGFDANNKKTQ